MARAAAPFALRTGAVQALQAALSLAQAGDRPLTTATIATRHRLPRNALAKVLHRLVRAGLVRGTRGVGGGYRLARPAASISILELVRVFEPPPGTGASRAGRAGAAGRKPGPRRATTAGVVVPEDGPLGRLLGEVGGAACGALASVSLGRLATDGARPRRRPQRRRSPEAATAPR